MGPNSATTGVPSAVPICIAPVSPDANAWARAITAPARWSPKIPAALIDRDPPASPANDHGIDPARREILHQGEPVCHRPALGLVRRPRRDRDHGSFRSDAMCGEPTIGMASRFVTQAEFRGLSVGCHVEGTSCLEESLGGRRRVSGIAVPLETDERGPRDSALRVPEPVPRHERPKETGPQVPVEVEFVRVFGVPDLLGQAEKLVWSGR